MLKKYLDMVLIRFSQIRIGAMLVLKTSLPEVIGIGYLILFLEGS